MVQLFVLHGEDPLQLVLGQQAVVALGQRQPQLPAEVLGRLLRVAYKLDNVR